LRVGLTSSLSKATDNDVHFDLVYVPAFILKYLQYHVKIHTSTRNRQHTVICESTMPRTVSAKLGRATTAERAMQVSVTSFVLW
jgi:hypothetical protein